MTSERRLIEEMMPIARDVVDLLRDHADWIDIGGSIRRGKATVKDIEIIAMPHGGMLGKAHSLLQATDALLDQGVIAQSLYGETQTVRWGTRYRGFTYQGARVELWMCDQDNRGYIHWLRTGPDSEDDRANTTVATLIKRHAPFSVSGGYVWQGERKLRVTSEEDWFGLLGLRPILPSQRTKSAYRILAAKSHRWGDVQRYLISNAPQQQMLSGLHWADLEDVHLHYVADTRAQRPANVIVADDPDHIFRWQQPWLRANGMVVIRDARGRWCLAWPGHPQAEAYRLRLERMSSPLLGAELNELNALLREQRQRLKSEDRMEQIVMCAIQMMRGAA
ncbi:MAG: hypothetical protein JNJ61_25670 [Anaerolineae bacterium]|nr:hypothetical protein [Anaerolineae bacterium]